MVICIPKKRKRKVIKAIIWGESLNVCLFILCILHLFPRTNQSSWSSSWLCWQSKLFLWLRLPGRGPDGWTAGSFTHSQTAKVRELRGICRQHAACKWALIITFLVQYSSKFAFLRLGARLENSLGNSNTISGGKSAWLQQRQVPTLRAGTREDVTEWQHVVINCRERTRQNTWYNEIFLP